MMTTRRLYAILRKAGIRSAKWYPSGRVRGSGHWNPGVHVRRDSDTHKIWFNVSYQAYGEGGAERKREQMARIISALQAGGIQGMVSDDGLTFRVEE